MGEACFQRLMHRTTEYEPRHLRHSVSGRPPTCRSPADTVERPKTSSPGSRSGPPLYWLSRRLRKWSNKQRKSASRRRQLSWPDSGV